MISRELWRLPEVSSVIKDFSDLPYMASTIICFSMALSDPSMLMAMVALGGS